LGLVGLLCIITYLDRVCISVAGPRMQAALNIGPVAWGWVTGAFTISYALFEIPSGAWGDRIGPRRVLTRIVLWWSGFTTLTGLVTGYYPLLATRFLFGAGEAGAYPNAAIVVSRWFPVYERGRALGIVLMAGQLGGAFAPLLVVPIQAAYGWRASFLVFGILGVIWSGIWYAWYRDSPREKPGVDPAELLETAGTPIPAHQKLPWGAALRTVNFWATIVVAFCYVYSFYFFQSWFHTYLVKAHGYTERNLLFSSLPFFVAAGANLAGGMTGGWLVKKMGLKWGRCSIGVVCLSLSAVCAIALMFTDSAVGAMLLLSLMLGGITFQQPIMFAVCLDIGGAYAGAMVGAMNTASQLGSLASSVAFGYLVAGTGNYNLPFLPMAVLLGVGAVLWLKVDPNRQIAAVPASST
jgi:ACS family glucarate transporter-like MFS transporter